jgi:hypothetical protein
MLDAECPRCQKKLSLRDRKGLLYHHAIYCKYCAKPIKIKEISSLINTIMIGVVLGVVLSLYTNLSSIELGILCAFVVVLFQRFIDIFLPLEPARNEDGIPPKKKEVSISGIFQ